MEGDEPTAAPVPNQQIIQAAEAAERAASSVPVEELVALVHLYMTCQAAQQAAMHRVHTRQLRSKSSNKEEVDSAAVAVSDDSDSAAEGRHEGEGDDEGSSRYEGTKDSAQ